MPLTVNEHYAASAACFLGGVLSCVTHLWMLVDFLPKIRMRSSLRSMHVQLCVANLMVVAFFALGAVSHFERRWIFGDFICKFYTFWCKFSPILAVGLLAACLFAEYQHASDPSLAKKDQPYRLSTLFAWLNAILWGAGSLIWSRYGVEPAGFSCVVYWYEVQPYVTYMSLFGFGLPFMIAIYYAFTLWSTGLTIGNPMAKATIGVMFTLALQFSGYLFGFIYAFCGYTLSHYAIAFAQIWTKSLGVAHPFVYSNMLAEETPSSVKKE
ncbi:rhodopsin, G0-coupled-like [Watersipora subatra]|uniref:rhodopsin, G0-coupled-like n=1 Tax=Watersipora subatra TaxID=2589382 RepID=UPI00355AE72F